MNDLPIAFLIGILVFLVLLSAFFSGSETGLMSLNRYRLRHLANQNNKGAQRASRLLEVPDRLIGLILLGNNFVNIFASSIATVIGLRMLGNDGVWVAALLLTFLILIFAEVTPKTLAALNPERIALPAAHILTPMLKLLYPLVWSISQITKGIFTILGIHSQAQSQHSLSTEELRIVVNEAASMIPQRHQQMLLSILDLEKVTVEDIMTPRPEITAIDILEDWNDIVRQLRECQHTRVPVYEDDIDHVIGILHLRDTVRLFESGKADRDQLRTLIREPYFIPESTPLNTQLLNFQRQRQRIGLVVNEYGDIHGLVTLEDILEEIVGEFTTDPDASSRDIHRQEDDTYLVDGGTSIRELNRLFGWTLPMDGPKTLNGLILEYLENIPDPGTSFMLSDYPFEVIQSTANAVKTVRINPNWKQADKPSNN